MLGAIRDRLPSGSASTVIGGWLAVAGFLALVFHVLSPSDMRTLTEFLAVVFGGLGMAVWPQHAAPPPPVTTADVATMPELPHTDRAWLEPLLAGATPVQNPDLTQVHRAALSLGGIGSTETTVITILKTILPVMTGLVASIETAAGASATVQADTTAIIANAEQAVSALSTAAPVVDVDTALLAVAALVPLVPAQFRMLATSLLALAQAAYSVFAPKPATPAATA